MSLRFIRQCLSAVGVAALVTVMGVGTQPVNAGPVVTTDSGPRGPNSMVVTNAPSGQIGDTATYIVRYKELPLALYNGSLPGLAAIPRTAQTDGRARLDVHSTEARAYVAYLRTSQNNRLTTMANVLGRPITARHQMQHALNAVVVNLTGSEAKLVERMEGVVAVERDVKHQLATDIGPGFIGASSLWWGRSEPQDTMFADSFDTTVHSRGEGIVIGDIDTGYNSASPSFSETDDSGYSFVNPLGNHTYLGQCGVAGISTAGCNNKVIGVYDEINDGSMGSPYSVEDTDDHGSHTASTAAGNGRSATVGTYNARISGVAPHANMVVYFACSNGCASSATSAAVDHAVADSVVDALNYSISGGTDPWKDSTSLAFLSAADAGIFVAAAAGNTSASVPSAIAGTANHYEPWVTTVAAGTHTGGPIVYSMSMTGPGSPPSNTQNVYLDQATGTAYTGTFSSAFPGTTPIVLSPNFHANDLTGTDGCAAYPAGTFTASIALVSRGTCGFAVKAQAAIAAGAVAIVIADNRPEALIVPSLGATAINVPVFLTSQASGLALQSFLSTNGNAGTAQIPYAGVRLATPPDVLASFSLLGPATIDAVKPDVQAPGVSILAAYSSDGSAGGPAAVGFLDGTSMATPHTTGAGGLLLGAHPDWTPMEVKSALMMTAKESGLTKPNGVAASDNFDRGSGRIQVDIASKAGLVLNETGLNFLNADPSTGGDPSTLNLASMQNHRCITQTSSSASNNSCSFARRFRSTQDHTVTWTAAVTGGTGFAATVTPASFSTVAYGTRSISVSVDASAFASDGVYHFGEVVLTPDDTNLPALHLPVAVAIPAPSLSTPSSLAVTIASGSATTGTATLPVTNVGGATLNVTNTNFAEVPLHTYYVVKQPRQGGNGFFSSYFTDQTPASGSYVSDDFTVTGSGVNLSRIFAEGFSTGTALTSLTGHLVHFRIYGDASGVPNGAPEALSGPGAAPVWSFDATIGTTTGLSVTGNNINLDLTAGGITPTNLSTGHYWLLVYPDMAFNTQGGWAWRTSNVGSGSPFATFGPVFGDTNWVSDTSSPGLAVRIEQQVTCGAPWLSAAPPTLTLPGLIRGNVTVTVDGTLFPPFSTSAVGFLCLQSNDAVNPLTVVRVQATKLP